MTKALPQREQMLCRKFCSYYKPGKNEALSCRGAVVVERLMRMDRKINLERTGDAQDRAPTEAIVQRLCSACDFHEQDCDFMQDRTAPPCGGFLLLAQLVASGEIKLEEL